MGKAGQKPKRKTPTKRELAIFARRERVLELRETGASIRQIADHLSNELVAQGKKGVSRGTIHSDLIAALEDLYTNQRLKTKHLVQLEINKLDRLELAHFSKLLKASSADEVEKYTRAFERVWKRRDALLGLQKPQKVELSARESLAKLLGKDTEELPDGDPDS